MADTQPFAGKAALVTGGSRGIGAAIAAALAADGAALWLVGRDRTALAGQADALRRRHGTTVHCHVCDLTDAAAVAALAEAVAEQSRTLDILVNNAGAAASAPLGRTDDALWHRMIDTNLTAVFRVTRALLPLVPAATDGQGGGRVVNVASTAGLIGMAYVTAYCAAKHGVVGLTRALAKELAPKGITVNAVCPGYTDTELVEDAVANIAAKTALSDAEARARLIHDVPIGRYIRPEEVAAVVRFLCLPEGGGITGTAIPVAGGVVG